MSRMQIDRNTIFASRHKSPNKRRIDNAFPVSVKIKVPPIRLGNVIREMQVWLRESLGARRLVHLPTRGATGYYFRTIEDAEAF